MKTKQVNFKSGDFTESGLKQALDHHPQLVFVFGATQIFESVKIGETLTKAAPGAIIIGCTTAGEISDDGVSDNGLVVTGVHFEKSNLKQASAQLKEMGNSRQAGEELGRELKADDLKAILVFGKGVNINGTAMVQGIQEIVGQKVLVTGGLAGDGGRFQKTYTLLGDQTSDTMIVGLGIYGESTRVLFGSMGGWEGFGPVRKVTRSENNVLYELDGKPALAIYKEYLGTHAKDLPGSGLLFPFSILKDNQDTTGLIRTILSVDEKVGSVTFAGNIPMNGLLRLMHAKSDDLIAAAGAAAKNSIASAGDRKNGLAILVSCVGRKLVLGDDVEDEIDAVKGVFGNNTMVTGFYSYGEICPQYKVADCKLHNQTMTITYIDE